MILVPLTRGLQAVVDDEDAWVLNHKWFAWPSPSNPNLFYAARSLHGPRRSTERMHRAILGDQCVGLPVDHIDGDGLNNRRSNLRAAEEVIDHRNIAGAMKSSSTGALGVNWHPIDRRWQARIKVDGRRINIGLFATIEEAKSARLAAEKKYWGIQPRRASAHGSENNNE